MGIPNEVLEKWSKPDEREKYVNAHKIVRDAIGAYEFPNNISSANWEIFLQGSYKNSTTVDGDSDVDVVVMLKKTFTRDTSKLSKEELKMYSEDYSTATYLWSHFREDVTSALNFHKDTEITKLGNKCIKIKVNNFDTDVIPCLQYRIYKKYSRPDKDNENYIEGIKIHNTSTNEEIINFPKQHYENGNQKSGSTDGKYKQAVRMFKNARNHIIDVKNVPLNAPSYFIECLLYNVPDECYTTSLDSTYCDVVNYLIELTPENMEKLFCQNEMTLMFGKENTQWDVPYATKLIREYVKLWNDWRAYVPIFN